MSADSGGGFTFIGTREECKEVLRLLSFFSHDLYEQYEKIGRYKDAPNPDWYLLGYFDDRIYWETGKYVGDGFDKDNPLSPEELLQTMYHDGGMKIALSGPFTGGYQCAAQMDFFDIIAEAVPHAYFDGYIYDDDCVKYALLKDGILRIRYRWGDDPVIEDPKDEDWEEIYEPGKKKTPRVV